MSSSSNKIMNARRCASCPQRPASSPNYIEGRYPKLPTPLLLHSFTPGQAVESGRQPTQDLSLRPPPALLPSLPSSLRPSMTTPAEFAGMLGNSRSSNLSLPRLAVPISSLLLARFVDLPFFCLLTAYLRCLFFLSSSSKARLENPQASLFQASLVGSRVGRSR